MTNEEIIDFINHNEQTIKEGLIDKEVNTNLFSDYLSLKIIFSPQHINDDFKWLYKKYWAMNSAGLTEGHFIVYFDMLDRQENNLSSILHTLYEIPRLNGTRSLQLSFATKLLHTLNNDRPIYDKWVAKVFFNTIETNDYDQDLDSRVQNRVSKYQTLEERCHQLLANNDVLAVIRRLRQAFIDKAEAATNFRWDDITITNTKMLDFIIWQCGQILFR